MTWKSHGALLIGIVTAFCVAASTVSAAVIPEDSGKPVYTEVAMAAEAIAEEVEDDSASQEVVSTSDVASFVRDLYVNVLGRDPDPEGPRDRSH